MPPPSVPLPPAAEANPPIDYTDVGDPNVSLFAKAPHPEILGYRGRPGGGGDEIYWDPTKPHCVPSDHRPSNLFRSREAAEAAAAAVTDC